jgi:hypothetical protein
MQRDLHGYQISTIGKPGFGIDRRTVADAPNTIELEGQCVRLWAIDALESIFRIRASHCGHKNE